HADLQVIATCELVIESVVWQLVPALSVQGAPTQTFSEDEATVTSGDVFTVSTATLPLAGAAIPTDADIGQLVVTWRRKNSTASVKSRLALPYVPLVAAPVLLEAQLPAFGAVRQPVKVEYTLRNVTMGVLELQLRFESTDLFMFAGDKQAASTSKP
uniref:Uncharacterized protein n=1 Tax=Plectus sambesii TaxID=2011161 RepID=A0A914UWV0_9BILA